MSKEKKKEKITKDMTFIELMTKNKNAAEKLADQGLFCGGCPMAQFETIENGAQAHGVDVDKLIRELNDEE
jgi:hybrid cluster-associated redox disulfide protein